MEWYYTVLIAILVILAIVLIFLYIFRERIFNWVMAAILGIYIASPLDLLPDFIPIADWGDDIAALVLMVGFIVRGFKMMYNKKNDNDTQVKQIKGE
ncbi:MAG: YkvA family protein [Methanofastidiosum sp.]